MALDRNLLTQEIDPLDFTAKFGVPQTWATLLGLRTAQAYCATLPAPLGLAACVNQVAIDCGLQIDHIKKAAQLLPQNGALLVTANHPTGILDGVVLLSALLSRRSDVWIVANDVLSNIPVLKEYIIPVKKTDAGDTNGYSTLVQVRRAWKRNQCVVVFPAGTVAHWQWNSLAIADAPWASSLQTFAAALKVPECRATLTIRNPAWFHFCAAISRKARLALLLRAFFSKKVRQPLHPVSFKLLDDAC